jgi:hypothetical protein
MPPLLPSLPVSLDGDRGNYGAWPDGVNPFSLEGLHRQGHRRYKDDLGRTEEWSTEASFAAEDESVQALGDDGSDAVELFDDFCVFPPPAGYSRAASWEDQACGTTSPITTPVASCISTDPALAAGCERYLPGHGRPLAGILASYTAWLTPQMASTRTSSPPRSSSYARRTGVSRCRDPIGRRLPTPACVAGPPSNCPATAAAARCSPTPAFMLVDSAEGPEADSGVIAPHTRRRHQSSQRLHSLRVSWDSSKAVRWFRIVDTLRTTLSHYNPSLDASTDHSLDTTPTAHREPPLCKPSH